MNKFTVIPGNRSDLDILLNKDIKSIIVGVKNLSIYPFELDIDDIINIANSCDKEIIISMNKMIHNYDLDVVREVLNKVKNSNISKIMFYDLGIFNIIRDMDIDKELIISQEHLNASIKSNEFYCNKGIGNTFISSDITCDELIDIKNSTSMSIYYTVFGYLPIFYSRRSLLSNYFKYIDKDMDDDTYYIFNNDLRYMIKEYNYGTIIYSPLINLINELDRIKKLFNLVIDLSYVSDISIVDKFINGDNMEDVYTGFFDKKTVYMLKDY